MRLRAGAKWLIPVALGGILAASWPAIGADHVDSPIPTADGLLDITDIYVFKAPANANNLVIALNMQSIFDPAGGTRASGPLFADAGIYQINIDRGGDLGADTSINVTFSNNGTRFTVTGLTGVAISGDVTQAGDPAPRITTSGGITAFAGPRDDPFFFDLLAFRDFTGQTAARPAPYLPVAGLRRTGTPDNFFKSNVASIVLEIPSTLLNGGLPGNVGTLRIWAKTFRRV